MKQKKISGVYKITNNITNECYIGSSKDIKERWHSHRNPATWKQHPNSKLYKDMAKFDRDNFVFEIVEETNNLKEREQYWIDRLEPGYNVMRAKGPGREYWKEYHKEYSKKYQKDHRAKHLDQRKVYNNRLCLYRGETLTLGALSSRLHKQGITHPCKEAKKYLI